MNRYIVENTAESFYATWDNEIPLKWLVTAKSGQEAIEKYQERYPYVSPAFLIVRQLRRK